ncbi:MAG: hypothetical protein MI923_30895 [Phycisphaerales bacterium]|nr:hypothetical protein [Phycisphaerales bacterium]
MDLEKLRSVGVVTSLLDASRQLADSKDYSRIVWLHWFVINRMLNEHQDPNVIGQLQFALLEDLEVQWIDEIDRDGFIEPITEGLLGLLEHLCRNYHVVSRSILGTIILLTRSGTEILRLEKVMHGCRWGYDALLQTCTKIEKTPTDYQVDMINEFADFIPSPSKDYLDPVAALLYPDSYSTYLSETPWSSNQSVERPFENAMVRSLSEIGRRLDPAARAQILQDLRNET